LKAYAFILLKIILKQNAWSIMNIQSKEFLNHQDAADYLHLKPATLYRYVVKGKVKLYKVDGGALNLYKKSDLDLMIKPVKGGSDD
jgi:hypothetical protein